MTEDTYSRAQRLARAVQNDLQECLSQILSKLGDPYLVRAKLAAPRIKSRSSLNRKARSNGWPDGEEAERAEDFLGFRIVCNNLQDVERAAYLMVEGLEERKIKVIRRDYIQEPKASGYRAVHLLFRSDVKLGSEAMSVGCEIQIRTLVQDAWAILAHEDIYKGGPPPRLLQKSKKLSHFLARADKIAEEIRIDVARPRKGQKPSKGAILTRSSIAFVYRRAFGEDPPDYVVEWIVREFGATAVRCDGLDKALQDEEFKTRLHDAYANQTRWGPGPEHLFRWAVIAATQGKTAALKEAGRDGKSDWKDVDRQYKSEIAFSVPNSMQELQDAIFVAQDDGDLDWDVSQWAGYFDAGSTCVCGAHLVDVDTLAYKLTKHFKLRRAQAERAEERIRQRLLRAGIEDSDGGMLCSYCRYAMTKD